ncbi:MAG: tetratricopeptide repeat protein [Mucilaginibacter sp.]
MFTNNARIILTGVFLACGLFFSYHHNYELMALMLLFIVMLIWGYFKDGTIILAAKSFHKKDYAKTESLLKQITHPSWLSKKRRGFYEFIMGGIALKKQFFEAAQKHYELAAQYPLRTVNDHVAALVHVANISIRLGDYDKARQYLHRAEQLKDHITAKMKEVIVKIEQELKQY